jgi:hypothetical protein
MLNSPNMSAQALGQLQAGNQWPPPETQYAPPPADPANVIDAAAQRIEEATKQVAHLSDRLQRIVSRAFGESPQGKADGPRPVPQGSVGNLGLQIEQLLGSLNEMVPIINRIDVIV